MEPRARGCTACGREAFLDAGLPKALSTGLPLYPWAYCLLCASADAWKKQVVVGSQKLA